MATTTSALNCSHCKAHLEEREGYRCACEEELPGPFRYYCDICILQHTRIKHVVKDRKGEEIATCTLHSVLPSFYCCTEKRLACIKCSCQKLNHHFVNISEEAMKYRKQVFHYWNELEQKEKDLKFREVMTENLLSKHHKQVKRFDNFVHHLMKAIEQKIIEKRNQEDKSREVELTKDETATCIDRILYFQGRMRHFLALSDGALILQFVEKEDQIVSLIEEQDRLANLVSFSESSTEDFDTSSFIQQTADEILTKIKLPLLEQVVSKDLTATKDVEIDNLDKIENEMRTDVLIDNSSAHSGCVVKKQAHAGVYVVEQLFATEIVDVSDSANSATGEVLKSKVRIEKFNWFSVSTSTVPSTVNYVHNLDKWSVLMFENGMYCVYDVIAKKVVKSAQIGYANVLGPVEIDNQGNVEWAYWDEQEKMIKVSGNDKIKVSVKQKPRLFKLQVTEVPNQYRSFAVVDEESNVMVINPNSTELSADIPQSQHTLKRVDLVSFISCSIDHIGLYDLISNRMVVLQLKQMDRTVNNTCTEVYPYKVQSINHWRESKAAIVLLPTPFVHSNLIVATLNVGTPDAPKFYKTFSSFENVPS